MLITPLIKDRILFHLCNNWPVEKSDYRETKNVLAETETDLDTLRATIYYFERIGFVKDAGVGEEHTSLKVLMETHDHMSKGGFAFQEELFKANIEKLGFEIENLRKQLSPDHLDSLNKISSIVSAITGGLALLQK